MSIIAESLRDERIDRPGHILEDAERQLIILALKKFHGHRAKSAEYLGMGLRTLGMKIKLYGLSSEWFRSLSNAPPAPPPYIDQIRGLLQKAQLDLVHDEYRRLVDLITLVLHDEQIRLFNLLKPAEDAA